MKSNVSVTARVPSQSGGVVRPREVTCSAIPQKWLSGGANAIHTFPTTCVHMWTVASVSLHPSRGSGGQSVFGVMFKETLGLLHLRAGTSGRAMDRIMLTLCR